MEHYPLEFRAVVMLHTSAPRPFIGGQIRAADKTGSVVSSADQPGRVRPPAANRSMTEHGNSNDHILTSMAFTLSKSLI